jgi:hypothetical protein
MDVLIATVLVIASAIAGMNYAAERWATKVVIRSVFFLSIAPPLLFVTYAAIEFGLAVATHDIRYFGADIGLGVAIVSMIIWLPIVYVGARLGRASKGY